MKNIQKQIVAISLGALCLFASCAPNEDGGIPIAKTYSLIDEGKSYYKILTPENPESTELVAANVLSSVLEQATGCSIPVMTDAEYDYASSDKIISIGDTKAREAVNVTVDKSKLNTDGFRIVNKKGQIYVLGGESEASYLYSAYELLNVLVDYEVYYYDEIYYKCTLDVDFSDMDITEVPSFAGRDIQTADIRSLKQSAELVNYFRLNAMEWSSNGSGHNIFTYLPPSVYYEQHNDWYTSTNTHSGQFCWSQEDMLEELCKKVLEHVLAQANITYFGIGQNDGQETCACYDCQAAYTQYGARNGLVVKGLNQVARYVHKYFEDNNIDREVYFVMMAYNATLAAPAVYDEAKGEFVPTIKCDPHVVVNICPSAMDYYYAVDQTENVAVYNAFKGWDAVCDTLMYYGYFINFTTFMVPFCNYNSLQKNYQFLKECGVNAIMETGGWSKCPGFIEVINYLSAKLMWNVNEDYVKLTTDFFNNYYKEASADIQKFFYEYRDWYAVLEANNSRISGILYVTFNPGDFPEPILARWEGYCNDGIEKIAYLKDYDPALYQKLYDRIEKLTLFIDYARLVINQQSYPADELMERRRAFKAKTEKFEITRTAESKLITDIFKSWGI